MLVVEEENIGLDEHGRVVSPLGNDPLQKENCLLVSPNEVQGFINPLLGDEVGGLRRETVRFVIFPINNGRIGDTKTGSGSH